MMTRYFKNEEKPQVVPTDEQAEDLREAPAAIPGETEADAEPKVDVPLTELPSPSRSWAPQTPPPFRTPCLPHGSASSDLQRPLHDLSSGRMRSSRSTSPLAARVTKKKRHHVGTEESPNKVSRKVHELQDISRALSKVLQDADPVANPAMAEPAAEVLQTQRISRSRSRAPQPPPSIQTTSLPHGGELSARRTASPCSISLRDSPFSKI